MAERPVTGARPSALGSRQTVGHLVAAMAARLNHLDDPHREARELLAALLDVPRHWPLVRENKWVELETWDRACAAADKRGSGAPMAYAAGRANFRHLTLDVDERVLVPRPETELLVDLVLKRCGHGGVAADIGTGSGAIALSLASEGKFDRVIATDISLDALTVARGNATRIECTGVEFVHCDLLPRAQSPKLRAVVSNPPYISFSEIPLLPPSVRDWEPSIALFSAREGLETTARLVRQAAVSLEPGGLLALEVDARRAALVAELVASNRRYEDVNVHLDLAGRERFVLARRRSSE